MSDRLVVDLSSDGRVSVTPWLDGELPGGTAGEPFELVWPLNDEGLEDLRWYLEDYLRAPFGVYSERGPEVEAAIAGWGEAVFRAVFGSGAARDAYVQVRARTAVGTEVVFRSSSPALLALPWELLRDPGRPTPLALDLVGVTRTLPTAELGEAFAARGEGLRVLMVISRPAGAADVGYRMVARPLLQRLEAVRGRVELVVLRPPTLEALGRLLSEQLEADRPFQVVHFDGHGVLTGRRARTGSAETVTFDASAGEGVLIFEKPGGGRDEVPAASLAQVLKAGQVPLVVLNACQSGAVGKELEAAVATRLLQEGIGSVVAMAYSVYAVAAAEFMAAFYERLFAGDGVTEAVSAGRGRLYERNKRPSPKGELPLADWVVPVHYLRREVHFPYLQTERSDEASLEEALDSLREQTGEEHGALEPVGTFVGRDGLFYELEVAARLQRVVILHGPGGTGKTELAKAFGRWWRDTGGVDRPDWVIVHSFEPGVASFGLDGVVAEIGLQAFGADFARLDARERREVVEHVLQERRLLLIWDNFESVFTMPDPTGATPPLEEAGREELRAFLHRLADAGHSSLILTSRTKEHWLGDLRRIEVGGLATDEAIEYAEQILAPYPAATSRRANPAFAELLQWLDGHPLSMRLVLPHLAGTEPEVLLAGLRGSAELPDGVRDESGRLTSLAASVTYSFEHLGPDTRRLLVAVCLFHGVADADVLPILSRDPNVPARFSGIDKEAWVTALDAAAGVGLLTELGAGMYRVHPALPAYLAAQWRRDEPGEFDRGRAAAEQALSAAYAGMGAWLDHEIQTGDAGLAFAIIALQRRTLGHLLGLALDTAQWQHAQAIAQPLTQYFNARGLHAEARAWVDRARLALEGSDGAQPPLDSPAGGLWLFLVGSQARREVSGHQLDSAERTYLEILDMLQAQPCSDAQQNRLAVSYHQLGVVAQERGRLDDAEDWYTKSLTIEQELGNRAGMASTYHQLGIVAQEHGHLDDAEDRYTKSLATNEELGNRTGMASTYHQLGAVAEERGHLDDAEDWYAKSLTITEELGDRAGMAGSYHQLGILAEQRGHLDDAEDWYTKALTITEELGDRAGMASTYHQLGIVAQRREHLDDAEDWYTKSLTIEQELGNRAGMASTYHQLGIVAQRRGHLDDAEDWYTKSITITEELANRPAMARTYHQLGTLAQKRGHLDDAEDWYTKSLATTEELGNRPAMAGTYHQLGIVAQKRGHLDDAEDWYTKSLATDEELGNRPAMAGTYHQLGIVAQKREHLDDAEDWYAKSLTITEERGNRPAMARTYGQLALLAEARGQESTALEWMVKCVALFDEVPHPATGSAPGHLARLALKLGIDTLDAAWRRVTGDPLTKAVRDFIERSAADG